VRLIIAILHAKDADACVAALNDGGFPCTRLGSFGGFLDRDNVTLMIGVEAAQVDTVVGILRSRAKRRHERLHTAATPVPAGDPPAPLPVDVEVGGATLFVLQVDRFERL
jgi:uncharacterized protein YaaQ